MTPTPATVKRHAWISNAAFTRLYRIAKICMVCGLGLAKGERLLPAERNCPGKREEDEW
jgi:hypothetical protein